MNNRAIVLFCLKHCWHLALMWSMFEFTQVPIYFFISGLISVWKLIAILFIFLTYRLRIFLFVLLILNLPLTSITLALLESKMFFLEHADRLIREKILWLVKRVGCHIPAYYLCCTLLDFVSTLSVFLIVFKLNTVFRFFYLITLFTLEIALLRMVYYFPWGRVYRRNISWRIKSHVH